MDWKIFLAELAKYAQARAGERSTYLGIIALAASLGMTVSPELAVTVCSVASAIAGAVMVATRDKKPAEE